MTPSFCHTWNLLSDIHIIRHSRNFLSGIQRLLLREAFSPSVVFYFFMFFVFSGVMRGQRPLIVDRTIQGWHPFLSFPKFLIGNPKVFTEEEGKIHRGFPLPLFRFLIKTLRNERLGDDRGIQGIQHHPSFPKSFIGNPRFCFFFGFLNHGPRLKDCRGDEETGIQRFLPLNNLDSW